MLAPVEQLEVIVDRLVADVREIEAGDVDRHQAMDLLLRVERCRERLAASSGRLASDLEARSAHAYEGSYSMANWLASRTGTARSVTGARARLARKVRTMPATAAAFEAGEITESHVRVLARALNPRTTDAFERDEKTLVDHARTLTSDQLAQIIEFWLRHNDPDGPQPRVEGEDDRFWLSRTMNGRLKGTLDLGGSLAITVERALDEVVQQLLARDKKNRDVDASDPALDQTAAQRRARALGELAERAAASENNPACRKPLYSLHTTVDTLAGAGDPSDWIADVEHAWNAVIPNFEIHLASCDCWMSQVILDTDGLPLNLGRERRTASAAQRRALVARDGNGCAVPGCDRPTGWCDAHHVVHWTTPEGHPGGNTDIDNLVHLCRWHHRRIHLEELTVDMVDGRPRFTNQAEQVLREPRSPTPAPEDNRPDADDGPAGPRLC